MKLIGIIINKMNIFYKKKRGDSRFNLGIYFPLAVVLMTVLGLLGGGCEYLPMGMGSKTHEYREFMMDTNVTVKMVTDDQEKAESISRKVFQEMDEIAQTMDRGVEGSDIWKINRYAGIKPVEVSSETMMLLEKAVEVGEETDGAFDITIAPLVDLWGFYDPEGRDMKDRVRVPEAEEIEEVLSLIDYSKVELHKETREVYLPKEDMQLELGGIAKGFVVDRGVEVLQEEGLENAFINAGDIRVMGENEDGEPWRIGIRKPHGQSGELLGELKLTDAGVDTSGNYERYFEEDGKKYHHILDPQSGFPAPDLHSVTGVSSCATRADALSTAAFIMGPQKGLNFAEEAPDLEAVLVKEDDEVLITSGIKETYKLELY